MCVCCGVATGSSINYEESIKSSIAKALARFSDGVHKKSRKVAVNGDSSVICQLKTGNELFHSSLIICAITINYEILLE